MTLWILMTSRVSVTSNSSGRFSRFSVSVTRVSFGPRIFLTASGSDMSFVNSPSILSI